VCRSAETLERPAAGGARPVPSGPLSAPEYALVMSHAAHDAPSQARGGCRACHAPGQDDGRPEARGAAAPGPGLDAHARCTRCHPAASGPGAPAGAEPGPLGLLAMNDCTRCHVAAETGAGRPELASGPYRVSFSHARHAARGHDDCRGCHAAVLAASSNALPAPRTEECAGCHDGAQAFSVLGPHCRRCHADGGPRSELRPRRGPWYSHREHQARGLDMPCTRCHQLDARGIPLPPAADHAPCSDAGCHREEFAARGPAICGACHLGTEPWLRLYFQPQHRLDTEFGARFSHRRHQQADVALVEPCERCHRQPSQRRDLGLPAQHETCMGTGCHERAAIDVDHPVGPTPLSGCTGCHELDLVARRRTQRMAAPWNVRERFEHAQHRSEPGSGVAVPCTACHQGVTDADSVAEIPGPPKRVCAPCHDGRAAFKLTGHGCARCHGGVRQP
jgi:c(7)-type cytochrome triheme protein